MQANEASYISEEDARAYASDENFLAAWNAKTPAQRKDAIRHAANMLDDFYYWSGQAED